MSIFVTSIAFLAVAMVVAILSLLRSPTAVADPDARFVVGKQEVDRGHLPYVLRRISVDHSITEDELRVLLLHQLDETRQVDYGSSPEHRCAFSVYAYTEPINARNARGLSFASIRLRRGEDQPELSIDERVLAAIKEPPQVKFGLDDDHRRRIYWELIQANLDCSDQADRDCPEPALPFNQTDLEQYVQRHSERFDELWQQRQNELANANKLSRTQLREIELEGMRKQWPQP